MDFEKLKEEGRELAVSKVILMSKKYYEGMFSSLKHNIFLLLNQMEGNLKYSEGSEIIEYLKDIELRIKEIKNKYYTLCTNKEDLE